MRGPAQSYHGPGRPPAPLARKLRALERALENGAARADRQQVAGASAPGPQQGGRGPAILDGPAGAIPLEHGAAIADDPDIPAVIAPDAVEPRRHAARLRVPGGTVVRQEG